MRDGGQMTGRRKTGPNGIHWSVIAAGLHVVSDFALKASCPRCGGQVVLYYCKKCNRPVWPKRNNPFNG